MTERKLKYRLGIFLVASHFALVLLCLTLYAEAAFRVDELTTLLAIIIPMVSGYSASVVTFFVSDRHNFVDETKQVTPTFASLSFAIPLVLVALIGVSILAKAYNMVFANFEDFKRILLLTESLFAVYAGIFVHSLFPKIGTTSTSSVHTDRAPREDDVM
ncbi:hypothetical protein [Caballeronia zhejiangensis]|jgi:hypothetical protein|uniref:hypothetical protein n=1 Tax=Caballeronia zhejiangensis TaxID=871203 RepID=UPI001FD4C0B1|nr:hypothetical protein [Caballeronia zhejiangensis]